MKQNILYIPSDNSATSGAFLQMVDMLKHMRDTYNINPIVALPTKKGTGISLLEQENLHYVIMPSIDWLVPGNISFRKKVNKVIKIISRNTVTIFKLAKLIHKENIDIIHINTIWTFVGLIAGLVTRKKVVWHIREAIRPAFSSEIIFPWGYKLINRSDKIISISKAVLDTYPEINKSKSAVVYDGIDNTRIVARKVPLFENKIIKMVCVGEIYTQKGQYDLVKACSLLLNNNIKNWHLTFIGNGALDDIKNKISELGLSDFIDVIGPKQNVHDYLAKMDIGFAPSWFEGFGRTAAEIAMSGCLLICSDAGAFTELYKDRDTALLHKSQSPEAICEAIKWSFNHLDRCKEIALKGQKKALENYTSAINASNVYKIYKEILGKE